ncbi:MAG: NAD-dependent DNA ligase LigA [Defluviitaleaceae bacterium]|nr:NAD-dependent DNA ligase LigA [Defluviitaleaceae bacterium]
MSKERIESLVEILNRANKAYEADGEPIMSDFEYDKLYDELLELEIKTGIALEGSPTQKVGYEIVSSLVKVAHDTPLLSLDKTKETMKLKSFLMPQGEPKKGILSWKLDGLTIVLKYANGVLVQAATRGNGSVGEDVTHNAKFFKNLPKQIPHKGEISIRGEAVISFSEFERINNQMADEEKYKNPRNLCSGTIRQLNSRISASRNVDYLAFALLSGPSFAKKQDALKFLDEQGFILSEYMMVDADNIEGSVEAFKNKVEGLDFATDGLVLTYDDVDFSESLGATSKFPRDSIAFKWADELVRTKFLYIEWNASRTGLINPIAVFEPVEVEGSTIERASLHNLSIAEALELGVGDEISVYKANMIIPQIAENFTKSGFVGYPNACPICDFETMVKEENGVKTLNCLNPLCRAKQVRGIVHYVGRDAANIEGFSIQTIEKFIELGYLANFADIYHLGDHEEAIVAMRGFGEKSFTKLMDAIEKSKDINLANFIFALGIDGVGLAGAKALCRHYDYDFAAIRKATAEEIIEIEGFGGVIANSINAYFQNEDNNKVVDAAIAHLRFEVVEKTTIDHDSPIAGKTFVITGDLEHFANRKELVERIEGQGGKVASAVSKKTDYLINNDSQSSSSKNKKALDLGVAIITEVEFLEL